MDIDEAIKTISASMDEHGTEEEIKSWTRVMEEIQRLRYDNRRMVQALRTQATKQRHT